MKKTIFLLGDSISLHYNPFLIPATQDRFDWLTKQGRAEAMANLDIPINANGGSSKQVLEFLLQEERLGNLTYDYLLFNCGLHDIAIDPGKTDVRVNAGDYHKNMTEIVKLAQAHGIKPIWITTTPVEDARHNTGDFKRYNTNVLLYNAIAKEIMKGLGVPIIDLYTFTAGLEGDKYADHVHYIEPVRELQAEFIREKLLVILADY